MQRLKRSAGRTAVGLTGLTAPLAVGVGNALASGSGVNITANSSGLPGLSAGEQIVGSFITVAVIASVLGVAMSAIVWSVGNHSANPQVAGRGKSGVMVSAAAAILAGGAMAIVNFFFNIGAGIGS